MLYIISIPHQSTPRLHEFESRHAFYVSQDEKNWDEAFEKFTHDLHGAVVIATREALNKALNYGNDQPLNTHRRFEVQALAATIDPETLPV